MVLMFKRFFIQCKSKFHTNLTQKSYKQQYKLSDVIFSKKRLSNWNSWDLMRRPTGFKVNLKLLVPGASLAGLSALCCYGIAGNTTDSLNEKVRAKIRLTFAYFAGSLGITSLSAYYIYKSGFVYRLMAANPWATVLMMVVLTMATSSILKTLPYSAFPSPKHLIWAAYCGSVSLMISPLVLMGGPLIVEAATITGGLLGGMTIIASCMKSETFQTWAGPLSIGLLGIFLSSIVGMFIPTTIAIGFFIKNFLIYGGLMIFGGLFMYETKKISDKAEFSVFYQQPFDPLNESLSIYMSTVNIFSRIVTILWSRNQK